jgi:Leucine Rich repeat
MRSALKSRDCCHHYSRPDPDNCNPGGSWRGSIAAPNLLPPLLAVGDNAAMEAEPPQADPPKRKRRWFQFSLRTLMILTLLVCVGMATWVIPMKNRAERQKAAVAVILKEGGEVDYDYWPLRKEPPGPIWLRKLLGDDFFTTVDGVTLKTDAGMKLLDDLPKLRNVRVRPAGSIGAAPEKLTDAGITHLKGLTQLATLQLQHTAMTDAGVASFKGLTELNILELDYTNLTDSGLAQVTALSKLGILTLRGTKVTDAGMKHLSGFTNLYDLDLGNTNVTDAGLAQLAGLPRLEILHLDSTKITDSGLEHLTKLPMLDRLDVRSTEVTVAGVNALQRSMPKLFEIKR